MLRIVTKTTATRLYTTNGITTSLGRRLSPLARGARASGNFRILGQAQRSYIFLPASFQEFFQESLQRAYTRSNEKRRTILVKLLQPRPVVQFVSPPSSPHTATANALPRNHATSKLATLYPNNILHTKYSKKRRIRRMKKIPNLYSLHDHEYHQQQQQIYRRLSSGASQRWIKYLLLQHDIATAASRTEALSTHPTPLSTSSHVPHRTSSLSSSPSSRWWSRKRESFRQYVVNRWKLRKVAIEEYSQDHWFDPNDGRPMASKTPFGRFVNPWNSESTNGMQSLYLFCQWRLERLARSWTPLRQQQQQQLSWWTTALSRFRPALSPLPPSATLTTTTPPNPDKIRLTWIGHSTCLVQMKDHVILTDPMFSDRASPFQIWPLGVKRHVPPAMSIEDLPKKIHVCVISHDHYDHLDRESIRQLKDRVEYWAVPMGTKAWFEKYCSEIDSSRILEMTWWEATSVPRTISSPGAPVEELQLVCTPAQHWCGRTVWDRNVRLWCSWVIRAGPLNFYFAGDTALPDTFPLHRQIGDRYGPFDLAALPIGAYAPRYFMKSSHAHPREAVQIHQEIQAKQSVAIHWGTFALADEEDEEPKRLLDEAAKEANVDFVTVAPGEFIESKKAAADGMMERPIVLLEKDFDLDDDNDFVEPPSVVQGWSPRKPQLIEFG